MTGKGERDMHLGRLLGDSPGTDDDGGASSPLDAREKRWLRRQELARALPRSCSLISFTLRMPAALRLCGDYDQRGSRWFDSLRAFLAERGLSVLSYEFRTSADGPEGFCVVSGGSKDVKLAAITFEESFPWCALTDVDVTDRTGTVVSRETLNCRPRRCLVCNGAAIICASSQKHSPEEIREAVEFIANAGQKDVSSPSEANRGGLSLSPALREDCEKISLWARTAVLLEAAAAPKPGLVTPLSNGAHDDMDYFTFLRSAAALAPFWEVFALLGAASAQELTQTPSDVLPLVRRVGLRAEGAMAAVTKGVNTHKGLIFSLGILCTAAGMKAAKGAFPTAAGCARKAAAIVEGIVEEDFAAARKKSPSKRTAGERLYLAEGVAGIRGEAERGFPSVTEGALPHLREALEGGMTFNDAMATALLVLMERVEDTNVLSRGGRNGEIMVREASQKALALGAMATEEGRRAIDEAESLLASRRLSPGGAADLLAVTVFLHFLDDDKIIAAGQ